jgi:hypothetical protein
MKEIMQIIDRKEGGYGILQSMRPETG